MRVLGIDPGICSTGIGIVDKLPDGSLKHIHHTTLTSSTKQTTSDRLEQMQLAFIDLIQTYKPDAVAIEEYFSNGGLNSQGSSTTPKLIGALMVACAAHRLPVTLYSPMTTKAIAPKPPKPTTPVEKGSPKPKRPKVTKKAVQAGVNARLGTHFDYAEAKCHPIDSLSLSIALLDGKPGIGEKA